MSAINDFSIIKEKTVAFTGHRHVEYGFNKLALNKKIEGYILKGFDTFLVGMAVGFDTLVLRELLGLREKYKIRIIGCVPCPSQDKNFNEIQKEEYKKMLERVVFYFTLSNRYTPYCMQKRNVFMVDNASILIAYLKKQSGGTKNTVEYAKKQDIIIDYV